MRVPLAFREHIHVDTTTFTHANLYYATEDKPPKVLERQADTLEPLATFAETHRVVPPNHRSPLPPFGNRASLSDADQH